MNRLIDQYDSLIADADGVIYRGPIAVPHALESLRVAIDQMPWCVVTNNAAMPPSAVADRISGLGLAMEPSDVVTSPQGAVAYLLNRGIPAGAPILIVGGPGIDEAVAAAGFTPMREHSIPPVAVVQGFGPDVGWRELSEAGYAIAAGALWVATNLDLNIPTERGLAPGNGALVGAVEHASAEHPMPSPANPNRSFSNSPPSAWGQVGHWSSVIDSTPTSVAPTAPAWTHYSCSRVSRGRVNW